MPQASLHHPGVRIPGKEVDRRSPQWQGQTDPRPQRNALQVSVTLPAREEVNPALPSGCSPLASCLLKAEEAAAGAWRRGAPRASHAGFSLCRLDPCSLRSTLPSTLALPAGAEPWFSGSSSYNVFRLLPSPSQRAEAYSLASRGQVTGVLGSHHSTYSIPWGLGPGRRRSTYNNSLVFSQLPQTSRSNADSTLSLCNLDAPGSFLFGWLRKENNNLVLLVAAAVGVPVSWGLIACVSQTYLVPFLSSHKCNPFPGGAWRG